MTLSFAMDPNNKREYPCKYISALLKGKTYLLQSKQHVCFQDYLNVVGGASIASRIYIFLNTAVSLAPKAMSLKALFFSGDSVPAEVLSHFYEQEYKPSEDLTSILSSGQIFNGDLSLLDKDSKTQFESPLSTIYPFLDHDYLIGFVGFQNATSPAEMNQDEKEFQNTIALDLTQYLQNNISTEKLASENIRFQTTMDSIEAVIYVADMKTHELIFLNDYGKRVLGKQSVSLLGQKCYSILQENQFSPCEFCTNHLLVDEEDQVRGSHVWEFRNTITGEWYQCRDQAIKWPDGRLVRLEVATNISDRQQMEVSLADSESRIRTLVETIPDIMWLKDPNGNYMACNHQFEKFSGKAEADIVGKNDFDLFPKKRAQRFQKSDLDAITAGKPIVLEEKAIYADDGHIELVETIKTPVFHNGGVLRGVMGIARDISGRKHAEGQLKSRDRYLDGLNRAMETLLAPGKIPYQNFIETLGSAIDVSRTYLFLNRSDESGELHTSMVAEWCAEGIKSKRSNPALQNLNFDAYLPRWRSILSRGEIVEGMISTFPQNELGIFEPIDFQSILVIPIHLESEFIGFMGFDDCESRDGWGTIEKVFLFSAAKDLALSIKRFRSEIELKQSVREKEVLIREIHHRVKNNMQVIVSLMRMYRRRANDPTLQAAFIGMEDRVAGISLIYEALQHSDNLSQINFNDYLHRLSKSFSQLHGSISKGISLKVEASDVSLDMDQGITLGLVIVELISNAFKHAFPSGKSGVVTVSLTDMAKNEYELIVADDGIGLPVNIDIEKTDSLGLHLAGISVTHSLGGTIKVERDRGTRFVIQFKGKIPE